MNEHAQVVAGIREGLAHLESRMELRLHAFEQRLQGFEQRVDSRLDVMDAKLSRQFVWIVGIQITTLIAVTVLAAVVGTLLARG